MQRRFIRAGALFVSLIAIGCAKADRAPPPAREPGPQTVPAPTPTSMPSSTTETPSPETPAEGEAHDELKKDGTKEAAEPQTLAEAEKALSEAKGTLDTLLGGTKTKPGGGATALSTGDGRCGDACKAMSSLRRAASAVCRLAGDGNARCAKAKGIVKDSETRVSACKCES